MEDRETAKCQGVKRCFCAQDSPGFLLYQLDISKLFLLAADLATNTPGGQAVSLAAHLPQYWSAWWDAGISEPAVILLQHFKSSFCCTKNINLLLFFGRGPFWLFSEPFGLSTTLGGILPLHWEGFALLSFWK